MRVPFEWLKDLVDIKVKVPELCDRLTMAGVEVGALEFHGKGIKGVVVGKIKSVDKLPSDHHLIAEVDIGKKLIKVISDDLSLKIGDKVPIALEGATIAKDLVIKKTQLHGVEVFGYLCKPHELGLTEDQQVLRIPKDAEIGEDVSKVIGLGGYVIDVDVLPNRGDLHSIIGIARETAALLRSKILPAGRHGKYKKLKINEISRKTISAVKVEVKDKYLCPRYMARVIEGVKIKESPRWLRNRLLLSGLRPINNVVDITNYLLLELGQPMHAFDMDLLAGPEIIVRRARAQEKIKTLDGIERKLNNENLLICDAKRPVALAGVMGSENTEVKGSTRNILLESAYFDPVSINKTMGQVKLRTESSLRFGKGVDWETVETALDKAAGMIAELGQGKVLSGKIDVKSGAKKPKTLELRIGRLNSILGTNISMFEAAKILNNLGIVKVKSNKSKGILTVRVPLYRAGDIEREVDLVEEVARIYGYHRMPSTSAYISNEKILKDKKAELISKVIEVLTGSGLYEAQTFSLVSPYDADLMRLPSDSPLRKYVKVSNPLSEDESVMRTMILPGLLRALSHNLRHRVEDVKLFEAGKLYMPDEKLVLGAVFYGKGVDFYSVKGVVEVLLGELINEWSLETVSNFILHPGKSAAVIHNKKLLGTFGVLHPDIQKNFDIPKDVYVLELELDPLIKEFGAVKRYSPLPKFPKVQKDVSMFVPEGVSYASIVEAIRSVGSKLVEDVELFDKYKNSLAFRITFGDPSRTLKDSEVNEIFLKIINILSEKLKVQVRTG